jgi:hypothetical protein
MLYVCMYVCMNIYLTNFYYIFCLVFSVPPFVSFVTILTAPSNFSLYFVRYWLILLRHMSGVSKQEVPERTIASKYFHTK